MNRFFQSVQASVFVWPWLFVGLGPAIPASAQPGSDRYRYDPREILSRLDANRNGQIEPDELSGRSRYYIERAASRASLDVTKPMPVDKLLAAMQDSSGSPSPSATPSPSTNSTPSTSSPASRPPDGRSSSGSSSKRDSKPQVPGFGESDRFAKITGFDVPPGSPLSSPLPLEKRYDRRVLENVTGILARYDKDKNDTLDAEEMKAVSWQGDPSESDLNRDGQLSKAELCERIAKRWGMTASSSSAPAVSSGGATDSRSSSSSGSASGGDTGKVRRYAESLLRQYDKNKNGVLDKDEWADMKPENREADYDRNGVITVDELTTKLSSLDGGSATSASGSSGASFERTASSSGGSSGSSSTGSGSTSRSRPKPSDKDKKGQRFLTPMERLPKGIPDWFLKSDANEDGQISMAEFASAWSESKVAEFAKLDLDGDGFVTPQECLKAEKK